MHFVGSSLSTDPKSSKCIYKISKNFRVEKTGEISRNLRFPRFLWHELNQPLMMVGVAGFEPTASKSQTSRATSCATPRLVKIFNFLGQIRKWSNLWSKVFCRNTWQRKSEETREKRRFCKFSAADSRDGHTLPNHARYQLRYIPILFFIGSWRGGASSLPA